jgi:phosphatidylethanolamine/phosphatidyl-N-methylethanolamine N-methyltransferase
MHPKRYTRFAYPNQRMTLQSSGRLLFVRSLLRNPSAVGALAPSSSRVSKLVASSVNGGTSSVLEIGAGTGSITGALLEHGVQPERLFLIERDPSLVAYLQDRFPGVRVRCGDAVHASHILSNESVGAVKTVVSSMPICNLSTPEKIATVRAILKALAPGGQLLQLTYAATCPLPIRSLNLEAERVGSVWMNLPPAYVWRFTLISSPAARVNGKMSAPVRQQSD